MKLPFIDFDGQIKDFTLMGCFEKDGMLYIAYAEEETMEGFGILFIRGAKAMATDIRNGEPVRLLPLEQDEGDLFKPLLSEETEGATMSIRTVDEFGEEKIIEICNDKFVEPLD